MLRMPLTHVRVAALLCLAAAVTRSAQAQSQTCPPGYSGHIFVDPSNGLDSGSYPTSGCPVRPFKTITYALTQASTTSPTTIVLTPGIYQAPFETFPLRMKRNVSIQGTNAVNTIIQGGSPTFSICPNTNEDRPTVALTSSLVLFDAQQAGEFDQVSIEGVAVDGGCIGIAITGAHPANPVIANCFIADAGMSGIDISSPTSTGPIHRPRIVHCTLTLNHVAITSRTHASLPGTPPINPPSAPGLLNVLAARSGDATSGAQPDFFGIRKGDMRETIDPVSGAFVFSESTSGFNSASSLGIGAGNQPQNPGFVPPGSGQVLFIEELTLGLQGWDLRLHPNWNAMTPTPVDTAFRPDPGQTLHWDNGTVGSYALANGSSIGDFDCEGYGNPRYDGGAVGLNAPDMGADEMGTYIVAGFVGGSTNFAQTSTILEWAGPFSNTTEKAYNSALQGASFYIDNGLSAPGSRPRKTVYPYTVTGYLRWSYLLQPQIGPFVIANPGPHQSSPVAVSSRTLFNVQVAFSNPGPTLSNLQTFTIDP